MTNQNPRRLDLDELERQLQSIGQQPNPPRHDPLAELARIVGEDDPFRAGLADEQGQGRREPIFDFQPDETEAARAPYDLRRAASVQSYDQGEDGEAPPAYEDTRPLAPRRSKKSLVTVGAVLGLGALGVGGALAFREGPSLSRDATPPVIQADKGPLKIQPQNPGGMDIPDQNKQIYERGAPEKQTRVVNREEQPIDVQQATRAIAAVPAAPIPPLPASSSTSVTGSIVPPTTATPGSGATPGQLGSLAASLGEPKRVKTVSIRPDGTVLSDASPARPKPSASASATPSASPVAPPRPVADAARAAPTETGSTQRDAAKPQAKLASLAAPGAASPAPAASAATGGFAVQLGHRPSEEDARTAFKELQKKYPGELGGKAPLIRKAEVNAKTVFRVRVGPLSKSDGDALCARLKTAGQPCFVAAN